jgi:putative Mg2+ transporter-C (MgtC) family protein
MLTINAEYVIRIVVACLLGAIVGLERRTKHYGLGLRTSAIISLTSCTFIILSLSLEPSATGRIVQGIITGIGFIGAAIIWRHVRDHMIIHGITTAACVLALTAIGALVGLGFYFEGIFITIILLVILLLRKIGVE